MEPYHPRAIFGCLLPLIVFCSHSAAAQGQLSIATGALISRDNEGYQSDRYQLGLNREAPSDGEHLTVRWHTYSLSRQLVGISPFAGYEPSAELGGHLLYELWWLEAGAGFQGKLALHSTTGEVVLARAIPSGKNTFTPRVEVAREPLAMTPLPLSLGLLSDRAEALLAFRSPQWMGEGGVRVDFWDSDTAPGRTQNPALATIPNNRITSLHGYGLSTWDSWFNWGAAAKVAWASHNTMLMTQVQPSAAYTWYPASAPPFAWEAAAVVQAKGDIVSSLGASFQLQLPLISQETRQWETLRRTYWGTAPFEAKLQVNWAVVPTTTVHLNAQAYARPWENWNALGSAGYRQGSVELAIETSI
ncbi:MAG TPA: hypothetical protein VL137_10175 [Polyangiaceae bacterium]|nr:hypothetical protein [Polyangiaceae bacterium]